MRSSTQGPYDDACGAISGPALFADADMIIRFGTTTICAADLDTRAV